MREHDQLSSLTSSSEADCTKADSCRIVYLNRSHQSGHTDIRAGRSMAFGHHINGIVPDKRISGVGDGNILVSRAIIPAQKTSVLDHRHRQGAGLLVLQRLRRVYSVFAKLDDGEFLFVASREELEQASQLAEKLNSYWPHEYAVRDSEGNDVDLKE